LIRILIHMHKDFFNFHTHNASINDRISRDLDINSLFQKINLTYSKVGNQYLYYTLRNPSNSCHTKKRETLIALLANNRELSDRLILILKTFNKSIHNNIPHIIFNDISFNVGLLKFCRYSLFLMIVSAIFLTVNSNALFFIIFFALINSTLHFVNKVRVQYYSNLFLSLIDFAKVVKKTSKIESFKSHISLDTSKYKSISRFIPLLLESNRGNYNYIMSEVQLMFNNSIEFLKSIFCIDYLVIEFSLKRIQSLRKRILDDYILIGELELSLLIIELRSFSNTCVPALNRYGGDFIIEDLSHPIVERCQVNSIYINEQNILITGSNMSGKTTFIRTIGINQLLAQTLGVCFASKYEAPICNILSAIHIEDNLKDSKSYFKKELDTFLEIIDATSKSKIHNLILIDEPLKGTNHKQSIAITYSVSKYLNSNKNTLIVTTHSLKLAELLSNDNYISYYFDEEIIENDLFFDYKIKKGTLKRFNAIDLLKRNKYPNEIYENALICYKKID
jgi:DNA mismatch repair ATPase MutS